MRIAWLQHVPFEGLGSIEGWAHDAGKTLHRTRMYANDALPHRDACDGLIVMGGPMGVYDDVDFPWLRDELDLIGAMVSAGKPVLGICLGAQLIASALGARVYRNPEREIGWFPLQPGADLARAPIAFPDVNTSSGLRAFHWHGDTFDLPAGALHLAATEGCRNQVYLVGRNVLGLQCHLETTRASAGALLEHCPDDLVPGKYVQSAAEILADDARFDALRPPLRSLLDYLFGK